MSSTSASASVPSLITSPAFHPHAPHILVSVPIAHSALHRLFQRCQVTYRPIEDTNQIITPVTLACGKMNADEIRQQCKEKQFSGLVVFAWDRVDAALMDLLPNVKCISTSSVGYDHIDIPAATQRSILIGYTPGILTETCADLTVGLILATSRRLVEAVQVAKSGAPWGYLYSKDVHSSTVGFVGLGRIGVSTARRLRAFNCRIIYSGPREKREEAKLVDAEYVSFDELLKQSDFVVPQCPLNNQTRHMFGKDAFQKMKPDAIFINTTRGGVVNQDALYEALKNGTILGAGLDVTDPEPLPPSHPLFTLPNAVILPHIASATLKCRAAMANMAVDNLLIALGEMDRDGVKGTYVNQHEIKQR